MRLKIDESVGKTYENGFGKKIKIIRHTEKECFIGDDGQRYGYGGVCIGRGRNWDLAYESEEEK